MKSTIIKITAALFLSAVVFSCQKEKKETENELSVDFEKFTLDNGLDVNLSYRSFRSGSLCSPYFSRRFCQGKRRKNRVCSLI